MEGILSDLFEIRSGVRQVCTILPSLFLSPMDWILSDGLLFIEVWQEQVLAMNRSQIWTMQMM